MLRSLVGSEMCIRDSCCSCGVSSTAERYLGLKAEYPNWIPPSNDLAMVCLLYTSDAADDLLCVDLGGRRILKKKTKKKKNKKLNNALKGTQNTATNTSDDVGDIV